MNEQKYMEILVRTGLSYIYHFDAKKTTNYLSRTIIDANNTDDRAAELIGRIAEYIDAILYEVQVKAFEGITDRFVFIPDGERFEFEPMQPENWHLLKERMQNSVSLRVEHEFIENACDATELVRFGMMCQLEDLLEGGRLADCVSMYTQIEMNEGGFEEDEGLEEHHYRYLWMNGMHNGGYICGEIPFVRDERCVRSCTGWRQSDPITGEGTGLSIALHPHTSPALLRRLHRSASEFARKVNCDMEILLNHEDAVRYQRNNSSFLPSAAEKAYDDAYQLKAPDLRQYFTPEEVQRIMDRYPAISALYIRHADPSCTQEQLEKVRFAWSLALVLQYEGQARSRWNPQGCMNDICEKTRNLPGEIVVELEDYAFRHTGLGDMSVLEDCANNQLLMDGACVRMRMAYLNGIEDVRKLCGFLNELDEIARLAQEERGIIQPVEGNVAAGSISLFNSTALYGDTMDVSGHDLEKVEGMPVRTLREHYEYSFENNRFGQEINVMNLNGMMFESDDFTNWARLRFRKADGRYVYEIAQAEI